MNLQIKNVFVSGADRKSSLQELEAAIKQIQRLPGLDVWCMPPVSLTTLLRVLQAQTLSHAGVPYSPFKQMEGDKITSLDGIEQEMGWGSQIHHSCL